MGKFEPGQFVITAAALDALPRPDIDMALRRHLDGDWGDVCEDDRKENELSLAQGLRLFSVYRASNGTKFWVITEAVNDQGRRESTCVLLPSEY